jgi:tyrosyl-tRNA synthetase
MLEASLEEGMRAMLRYLPHMSDISTDQTKIDQLLTRRVSEVIGAEELREKLVSGHQLRIKLGADPTAPDLHLGHAVALRKLREFQDLGHKIVLIVGDYTALVGDPAGKSKTRPMLSMEEIEANAQTYLNQVGKILDMSKCEIRRNGEWLGKMSMAEIIQLASKFTVARMIERDDFEKRLESGTDIHMHELLYPMMQAYDSVVIDADVEIGGTDQRFNNLAGRELQKKMGKIPQNVMLCPLLVGLDGEKKMSKSLGNFIGISDEPNDMFGKTMSLPDAMLWNWFELVTDLDKEEVEKMRTACESGAMNPRDAKMRLGREIVTQYYDAEAAQKAEEHFISTFQKKEIPEDIVEVSIDAQEMLLIDLLAHEKIAFAKSKSEARQLIEQGGVKVNDEVITDLTAMVKISHTPTLIQKGKRFFVKVKSE